MIGVVKALSISCSFFVMLLSNEVNVNRSCEVRFSAVAKFDTAVIFQVKSSAFALLDHAIKVFVTRISMLTSFRMNLYVIIY